MSTLYTDKDCYSDRFQDVREASMNLRFALDDMRIMHDMGDVEPTADDCRELLDAHLQLDRVFKMLDAMRQRQSRAAYGYPQEIVTE